MSGSGGCFTSGLSFGGRMSLPTQAADLFNTDSSPWMRKKVFILQIPRFLRKGKNIQSMFGPSGTVRFWKKDSTTCPRPTADDTDTCPIADRSSRPCLDKSVPCNVDLGDKKLLISIDTTPLRVTIELLIRPDATVGDNPVTGYKIECRKLNSNNWSTKEYSDTQPKDITDLVEEGFTYEIKTSLKYGDSYSEPEASETFTIPCRDLVMRLALSSASRIPGSSSVTINWMHGDLTDLCGVVSQTISVKQLDLDNCLDTNEDPIGITPDLGSHEHILEGIWANSEYNVSLTFVTKMNTYNVHKTIRTVETAPTEPISGLVVKSHTDGLLVVYWKDPSCGHRNGAIKSYDIEMTRNGGRPAVHNTHSSMTIYGRFRMGHSFRVRVRAVTLAGPGPYSEKYDGIFGEPTDN